jgi:predicted O-methyltransferase YrrM
MLKKLSINSGNSSIYLKNVNKIIADEYGFAAAAEDGIPIDKNNNPLPLYTYPAIEYLASFDCVNKKIFEFGSGQSTLYWLEQGADIVSVENNQKWIDKLSANLIGKNHQYIFANTQDSYANSILEFPDSHFDLIIIDGIFSRYLCAKNVIAKIKKDGLVILDNSDWYPNTAKFLRENLDFIQVDFYGFRPSRPETAVTSLFFSRNFNFKIKSDRQPNYAIGGKIKHSSLDGE